MGGDFRGKVVNSLLSSRYCATVWAAAGWTFDCLEAEGRPINLQYNVPISKDGAAGFAPTLTTQRDHVGFAKQTKTETVLAPAAIVAKCLQNF